MKDFIRDRFRDLRDIINYIKYFRRFEKVGKSCVLTKPILLVNPRNVELGEKVIILPGLRLETLEYKDGLTYTPHIKIGDKVTIGQNAHLFCASSITIGDNVEIGGNVMIDDCIHDCEPLGTEPIEIGENTIIGNNVLILSGVKIGKNCCIGGNVVISEDVPDYSAVSPKEPQVVNIPR